MTKAQQEILESMKKGEVLTTNACSGRNNFNHEAWIGEKRVKITSVQALESQGLIKTSVNNWNGATYILA